VVTKKIAYYLWRYPIVSETFIQREIAALKKAELNLFVVADSVDEFERQNPELNQLVNDTVYLFLVQIIRLIYFTAIIFFKNSTKLISLFDYVSTVNYESKKTLKQDILIK